MPEKETGSACIDIREDNLLALSAEVLDTLLRDHTTGKNIFWATHDYEALGSAYDYHSEILPELITGEHGMVIRPRVLKSKELQTDRSKDMAEVFTPSWVCNKQNNLVDAAWFGSDGVFNDELLGLQNFSPSANTTVTTPPRAHFCENFFLSPVPHRRRSRLLTSGQLFHFLFHHYYGGRMPFC